MPHIPAFDLPPSELLSPETQAILQRQTKESEALSKACPPPQTFQDAVMPQFRACLDQHFNQPLTAH